MVDLLSPSDAPEQQKQTPRQFSTVTTIDGSDQVPPTLYLKVAAYSKKVIGWYSCTICSALGAKAKPGDATETTGDVVVRYGEPTASSGHNWVWVDYGEWKEYLPVRNLVVLNVGEDHATTHEGRLKVAKLISPTQAVNRHCPP